MKTELFHLRDLLSGNVSDARLNFKGTPRHPGPSVVIAVVVVEAVGAVVAVVVVVVVSDPPETCSLSSELHQSGKSPVIAEVSHCM